MVIAQCFSNRRRKLRTLLSKPPRRINRIPSWYRDRWLDAIKKLPDETLERRPENLTSIEWVKLIENISNE